MKLDMRDIQIDTWTSGYKHLAVKLTHIPTGLVSECNSYNTKAENTQHALNELREMIKEHYEKLDESHIDNVSKDLQ